jgi:hypothetical protein
MNTYAFQVHTSGFRPFHRWDTQAEHLSWTEVYERLRALAGQIPHLTEFLRNRQGYLVRVDYLPVEAKTPQEVRVNVSTPGSFEAGLSFSHTKKLTLREAVKRGLRPSREHIEFRLVEES